MSERELIQPHEKRYQRRNEGGTFGDSDDQHKSLSADDRRHAETKKPRNEGDTGDYGLRTRALNLVRSFQVQQYVRPIALQTCRDR